MRELITLKVDKDFKLFLESEAQKRNLTLSDFIRKKLKNDDIEVQKRLENLEEKIENLETNTEMFLQDLKTEIYKSFSDFAKELAEGITQNLKGNTNNNVYTTTKKTTQGVRKNIRPEWIDLKRNPNLLQPGDTVILFRDGKKIETELIKSSAVDLQLKDKQTGETIVITYFISKERYDKEILEIYRNF